MSIQGCKGHGAPEISLLSRLHRCFAIVHQVSLGKSKINNKHLLVVPR